jgi:hypothetical protein
VRQNPMRGGTSGVVGGGAGVSPRNTSRYRQTHGVAARLVMATMIR